MKRILIISSVLFLSACTDADHAKRVLEAQGYKNVTITGYRWFGCGQHDNYHTGFKGIGPGGTPVDGIVCSGFSLFGKSATVRID